MTRDEQLRQEAHAEMDKNKEIVERDPYRLHYHLMPPVGLLNDPNGFIQSKGVYHLYYQWMPFKTGHGAKFWGHYASSDLVNWAHEDIALTPAEWYEKNGCYSGSAIEHDGKIHAFYTGNVKDDEGNRETYQCLAVSEDGVTFDKKGPVVHLPDGFTPHFRDPKVWKQDGKYYMVVGAQTKDLKGAVAIFTSDHLAVWTYSGILTGGGKGKLADFGYMFECPDLFTLNGEDVLIFSPQGLKAEGMKYRNMYQAGYVIGSFYPESAAFEHGDFEELDRGFDFYAPQTTLDDKGRRLLYGWMSVPDQNEQDHPTIEYKWLHSMTLPRELKVVGDKVWQIPVEELSELRKDAAVEHVVTLEKESKELEGVQGKAVELQLDDIFIEDGWLDLTISDGARLSYHHSDKIFTFERKSYVDGTMEKRQCTLNELTSIQIFIDTSSVEIFINGGEETFTSRFYPSPNLDRITFSASKKAEFRLKKWSLHQ